MAKEYKEDYDFFPKTWQLPADLNELKNQFSKKKNKTFIIKPTHMCQGRGIYLVRRFEDIDLRSGD
jgi:tubulin polyglutamylase TTLL6/13